MPGPHPVGPGTPAYAEATAVFNLSAPALPDLAATARSTDDVRALVREAAARDLPVRVISTGHASAGVPPVSGGLLVRTRIAGGVRVHPGARTARIPAGTTWGEVVEALAPHGLAVAHGSSPTVGAVGYLLRGGLSFYGRAVGLAGNGVRSVELVTADGELLVVDAVTDPALFTALRGGGGGFGVVTAVEVALFEVAEVVTGAAFWPVSAADRLLPAWLEWTREAPRSATTSVRIMRFPPLPGLPPELTSGPVFAVDGAVHATTPSGAATARADAEDLLGPLRAIGPPVIDTWAATGPAAVLAAHADPTDPIPVHGDHMLLDELGDAGAAAFLGVAGAGVDSPLVVSGLRQLGGAYADPEPGGGVLDRLDARFSYAGSGLAFDPAATAALRERCAVVREALRPWDTGRTVPGFVENSAQPQGHLDPVRAAEVAAVRARVDPQGRFRGDVAPVAAPARRSRAA